MAAIFAGGNWFAYLDAAALAYYGVTLLIATGSMERLRPATPQRARGLLDQYALWALWALWPLCPWTNIFFLQLHTSIQSVAANWKISYTMPLRAQTDRITYSSKMVG